ncbi:LCP family protein [Nonomuraea sp. NPDC051191]|uniref:LCP family protein n=1 Tax=Nonomuraea sp. NPDC051191 TaxID=3364372 RepID=UPI0037B0CCE7
MDDLRMLRDLGGALEHEPPATLVRQRERLLRDRPRRRWTPFWMAGLVAVGTAAAVAVPTLLVNGNTVAAPAMGPGAADMSGDRNILVIGSDTRDGPGNAKYGPAMARTPDKGGGRSDTILLVHVPADRGAAVGVSLPRDSLVRIPACGSQPARRDMINSAYNSGGASCLRKTLEKLTDVRIDHTVEVDFTGFKGMVDALGGVEITLRTPVDDKASKLKLPAGRVQLDGESALGYARLRRYGDGSDVQRIKRQQILMLALLKKAKSAASDPNRLNAFLGQVSKSIKTDMSLESMVELATSTSATRMSFVTVPWKPAKDDPNRLEWRQPEAAQLFKRLQ